MSGKDFETSGSLEPRRGGADQVLIFANPIAGMGKGRRIADQLSRHLRSGGFTPTIFVEPAGAVLSEHLDASARAVIVIGGDGTIRGVVRRWLSLQRDVPPILVIPMGTANLLAQHLSLHWDPRRIGSEVVEAIRHMNVRRLDTATINGEPFLLMAGVGIDAQIIHELDRLRRGPITVLDYLRPAALTLQAYRFPPITVTVDGKMLCRDEPALALIGNAKEYGTIFPLLPLARSDDGVLDVCVLRCRTWNDAARLFLQAASGEHLHAEGVTYVKGKHIEVQSREPVPVQVDGEPGGFTPVKIDLLPIRVGFIVR